MRALWRAFMCAPQLLLMSLVKMYRLLLSPWLGGACRFEPTCSAYSLQALEQQGALAGSVLTVYRLVRCQPWCKGGHDPVPVQHLFSRLVAPFATPATPSTSSPSLEKKHS